MASAEKTVRLDPVEPVHAAPFLERIRGVNIDALTALQAQGGAQFNGIWYGSAQIGALVISVEREGSENWLIVHALAALPISGLDVTNEIFIRMGALAKATGCEGIRIWTEREGLRRKLEQKGARTRFVVEINTDELKI